MLGEIYKTLKEHQGAPLPNTEDEFDAKFGKDFGVKFGVDERKVLLLGDLQLVSVTHHFKSYCLGPASLRALSNHNGPET